MGKLNDLTGQKFGRLTVLSQHLIEEANRIESYSDTLHRVIDITK